MAERLRLPLVMRDELKEALYDMLGMPDVAAVLRLVEGSARGRYEPVELGAEVIRMDTTDGHQAGPEENVQRIRGE